jgi:cytochrome P450
MRDTALPVRLTGLRTLRWGWRFARDPLMAMRHCFEALGPFVILSDALPFTPPFVSRSHSVLFRVPVVFAAGAAFHRELLSDPATWRGVSLLPGGPRNSAARRMSQGLTRMTGHRHTHYRKLIAPPLHKTRVDELTAKMAWHAQNEIASWPIDTPIDLWQYSRRLMQRFAVELLFGGNSKQGYLIANLISRLMEAKWSPSAFAPINSSITAYGRIVRECDSLERLILEWTGSKRGKVDNADLGSIIVNNPDVDGRPPSDETVVGQISSLFAASSEASQSTLTWSLILLTQFPPVAHELLHELRSKLGETAPSLDAINQLAYLDAVVKETMRILPPVPIQVRVAQHDSTISGHCVPNRTRVMLNTFSTNRMPDLYNEGDVFQPQRWFTIAPSSFEFPVFSGGPHSCPGYWFGLTAIKVALATILLRFRMAPLPGACIDYRVQPTLRPLRSLPVLLHRHGSVVATTPINGKIRRLVRFPQ